MSETNVLISSAEPVTIDAGVRLDGDLTIPAGATGLVIFAHGSGSSRLSPRNQRVAATLHAGGLGTLLFDLLTAHEEAVDSHTGEFRFDVAMLGNRLVRVTDWLQSRDDTRALHVGYFGASTGAAAALIAAADRPEIIRAVVSRGGRPDLASWELGNVRAPTLLIVGGYDDEVLALNEWALTGLGARIKRLEIVPGATHLFEEPGTLERVCVLAREWFERYLTMAPTR